MLFDNFKFVDLKQNTVPYIAVMCFGAWPVSYTHLDVYKRQVMGYTVLLAFTLFKTGSLAKSVFAAH